MIWTMRGAIGGVAASLLVVVWVAVGARPGEGVTGSEILIGLEGPTGGFASDEENLGMQLVMRLVNDEGGVHGRRLVARGYPRQGGAAVDEAVANARRVVDQDGVFLIPRNRTPRASSSTGA
jgi:ABC-type branched-subunit amino acid transport system substrate-binding protein